MAARKVSASEDASRLEEVLDHYAMAGPSRDRLQEWARKYPEFKRQLAEFTVQWAMSEGEVDLGRNVAGTNAGTEEEGDDLTELGLSLIRRKRNERPEQTGAAEPVGDNVLAPPMARASPTDRASLREFIDQQGRDVDDVIEDAQLSFDILAMLNLGRITFPTPEIRVRVAERLAAATGVAVTLILRYLVLKARFAEGASYAAEKPEAGTIDFFDAVRADPDMGPEAKRYWLEMEPEGGE